MPYHHDVVLKMAASDGQLQVSDSPEPILQSGATIIHHILHWEVIGSCPTLIMFVPSMFSRVFCKSYLNITIFITRTMLKMYLLICICD